MIRRRITYVDLVQLVHCHCSQSYLQKHSRVVLTLVVVVVVVELGHW